MTKSSEPLANIEQDDAPLTLVEIAGSVFATAFGVQSEANKKRDFKRGKPRSLSLQELFLPLH